ncbi:hypothetical protein T4B_14054, partial [Trichinella pseudospiralis]
LSLWKAHFNLSIIGNVLKRAKNEAVSKYAENLFMNISCHDNVLIKDLFEQHFYSV